MQKKLRILILEDNPADAELMTEVLRETGIALVAKRVDIEETFLESLRGFSPDLILSDYDLPRYNGAAALKSAKEISPEVPFILVTGAVGEEKAIEILTGGATDYVLKSRLSRLVPAVRRALAEAEEHKARTRAEEALRKAYSILEQQFKNTEKKHSVILETIRSGYWLLDMEGRILEINEAYCLMSGYSRSTLLTMNISDLEAAESPDAVLSHIRMIRDRGHDHFVSSHRRKNGTIFDLEISASYLDMERGRIAAFAWDVTDRKRAEIALRESEERLHTIFESAQDAIIILDDEKRCIKANSSAGSIVGLPSEQLIGRDPADFVDPGFDLSSAWAGFIQTGRFSGEVGIRRAVGDFRFVEVTGIAGMLPGQHLFIGHDITDRKQAEDLLKEAYAKAEIIVRERTALLSNTNRALTDEIEERRRIERDLRKSEEKYRRLFEQNLAGVVVASLDPESLVGRLIDCNDAFARILGYPTQEDRLNADEKDIFCSKADWERLAGRLLKAEKVTNYEVCLKSRLGETVWVILNLNLRKTERDSVRLIEGTMIDITLRKRVEDRMRLTQRRLSALTSELVLTEERERQHIAAVLHDSVAQTLAAIRMRFESLRSRIPPDSERDLAETGELVTQAIQQTRSILSELSPPVLYELGFIPALGWLAEQTENRHGIPVEFESAEGFASLTHDAQVLLYQAVRELLTNVVKHAMAKKAKVRVSGANGRVEIEVSDDGIGIEKTAADVRGGFSGGYGLFSIRERLKHFGGELTIQPASGGGTQVLMAVPLGGGGR